MDCKRPILREQTPVDFVLICAAVKMTPGAFKWVCLEKNDPAYAPILTYLDLPELLGHQRSRREFRFAR